MSWRATRCLACGSLTLATLVLLEGLAGADLRCDINENGVLASVAPVVIESVNDGPRLDGSTSTESHVGKNPSLKNRLNGSSIEHTGESPKKEPILTLAPISRCGVPSAPTGDTPSALRWYDVGRFLPSTGAPALVAAHRARHDHPFGSPEMNGNPSGDAPDRADRPSFDRIAEALAELATGQELLELPVRVVDADGQPVAKARLTPWALGSSRGHGLWRENDKWAGVEPEEVFTDEGGTALVHYPRYHDVEERIRTRRVTLYIDHPDFACVDNLHVEVPLETQALYEIKLPTGSPLRIRPLLDGALADLDDIFAFWSDGRSYRTGAASAKPADGRLRIPAMPPGEKSILLVKLDGDRATHFSKLTDFTCDADARQYVDVPLRPAVRIEGILSQNVPRPVCRGRVEARTLAPAEADVDRVGWFTWTPVRPDGSFAIDGWPADEPLQLIALCDGHIAANGPVPDVVENRREAEKIPVKRPQVFDATGGERIEVAMEPLVRCLVSAVDQDGKPASGVTVSSYPNVFWWNGGSYGYCHPLVRGERLLRIRDYYRAEDEAFPCPFKGQTDTDGKLTLELPVGTRTLSISSDTYELPIHGGRRRVHVKATRGETAEVVLHLRPRGAERKGEWDTLIDVVFRSSIRSCPLMTVWEQMDQFVKKYRAAMNQRDPRLVSEACLAAADALEALGNSQEATKWRHMAAEQTETAEDIAPDSGKKAAKD